MQVEEKNDVSKGIMVSSVDAGSPADKAQIKNGDYITQIDSKEIQDILDFEKYILKKNAGDKLYIYLNRGGREIKVGVTLEKAPLPSVEKLALEKLGLFVQDLTPQLAKQLNLWWLKSGVLISGVQKKKVRQRTLGLWQVTCLCMSANIGLTILKNLAPY